MIPCFQHLEEDLGASAEILERLVTRAVGPIREMSSHFFSARGQRIRPSLVLAFARMGAEDARAPRGAVQLAALTELIHSASLLHDDVVDKGRMRRSRLTVNARFGNKEAVLLGDLLLAHSIEALVDNPHPRLVASFHRITTALAEGQLLELVHSGDVNLKEADYFRIIDMKTAAFFAECCYMGAHSAGVDESGLERARTFGHHIGFAYQILDDLLDVVASSDSIGKDVNNDILHDKMTLPLLHCLWAGGDYKTRLLGQPRPAGAELVDLVRSAGSEAYCLARARHHVEEARKAMKALVPPRTQSVLDDLIAYLFSRFQDSAAEAAPAAANLATAAS